MCTLVQHVLEVSHKTSRGVRDILKKWRYIRRARVRAPYVGRSPRSENFIQYETNRRKEGKFRGRNTE